jgi:hypothetical protein
MADDRRKPTDSDIIADAKLLAMVDAAIQLPTPGSRHFAAAFIECLQNNGPDCAVGVSLSGDRGQFLLH